jgi:predicted PurR-regulated permease PerM
MAHLKPGDDSHTVSAAPDTAASLGAFSKRLMITLLFGAFALTLWKLTSLLIPLFGAILLGVGLRAASVGLARRLRIGIAVALGIVIIMIIALFAGSFWFFGTIIVHQFAEVARQVPAGVQTFVRWLQTRSYGPYLLDQVRSANPGSAAGWWDSLSSC